MRRQISVMLAAALCFSCAANISDTAYAETAEGTVGADAFWKVEGDTLTIYGTGTTSGYSYSDGEPIDCPWEAYREQIRHAVVEEGITRLGALSCMPNLESISLPDSLQSLGGSCFDFNPLLTEINIPGALSFGNDPQRYIFSQTPLVFSEIPDYSVLADTYLFNYTGSGQTSVTVPEGIVTVGYECFAGHSEIEEIILPESVQRIDSYAFSRCENLHQITFSTGLKAIGLAAFESCTGLQTLTLPEGLEQIEVDSFSMCENLRQVSFPSSLKTLGMGAFNRCTGLRQAALPEGLETIGRGAFNRCTGLQEITLPNSLTAIEANAFSGCTALERISLSDGAQETAALRMPARPVAADAAESSGAVGEAVFWQFADDTLTLSGTGETVAYFFRGNDEIFDCPWESYRTKIRHVVVEEGITALGSNLFSLLPKLETVSLPESLETVSSNCFSDNPLLRQINLPIHTDLGFAVFENCPSLFSDASDSEFQFLGEDYLYSYSGTDQATVTVPDGVTRIGYNCFSEHNEIERVILPESVRRLDNMAFCFCENLRQITIPDELEIIGGNSFNGCAALTQLTLPDTVTKIEAFAFKNCSNLSRISRSAQQAEPGEFLLPEQLAYIGFSAFENCTKLQKIVIPESCTYLGEQVFAGCTALEQCVLPNSLHYFNINTFDDCTALQLPDAVNGFSLMNDRYLYGCDRAACVLTLPEHITLIADSAMRGTENLIALNCPESLRYLNDYCFEDCKYLTELNLNDGLLEIGRDALSGCDALTELTIPASVTEIGTQRDCKLTDIYGTPGTAAEQFALANGIMFHDIAEKQPPQGGADMTLDYEKDGWYFGNSSEAFHSEYYLTEEDLAAVKAISGKAFYEEAWHGSCFGLSLTVVLAKNGVISLNQLQRGAKTLSEVEPTRQIESMINYYHAVQFANAYINAISAAAHDSPARQMWNVARLAQNVSNGESPFLLAFSMPSGSHAVVGYGHESGEWNFAGQTYDGRILIWDPNFSQSFHEDSCVYYNSITLDYCIPYYEVYFNQSDAANSTGRILNYCNDTAVLNIHPYPFADVPLIGDLDGDGVCSVADAVLLSRVLAEDSETEADLTQADVDADGLWTMLDLTALLRLIGVS